jgi:hypothetical protein
MLSMTFVFGVALTLATMVAEMKVDQLSPAKVFLRFLLRCSCFSSWKMHAQGRSHCHFSPRTVLPRSQSTSF